MRFSLLVRSKTWVSVYKEFFLIYKLIFFRINITSSGINEFDYLVEPMISNYVKSNEPLYLPPQYTEGIWGYINFTSIYISDVSFKNIQFELISGSGVQLTM